MTVQEAPAKTGTVTMGRFDWGVKAVGVLALGFGLGVLLPVGGGGTSGLSGACAQALDNADVAYLVAMDAVGTLGQSSVMTQTAMGAFRSNDWVTLYDLNHGGGPEEMAARSSELLDQFDTTDGYPDAAEQCRDGQ